MFQAERHKKIYDIVTARKSIKVSQLSEMLGISAATIRRDLEELDAQNRIIRTHGGAIAVYNVAKAISAPELISSQQFLKEKQLISQRAYEEINDYDTIIMDSASTTYELVKIIAAGKKRHLTIVSQTPQVIAALEGVPDCKIILLGGVFDYRHNVMEGSMAINAIANIRADKCFLGINGIDKGFGFSTPRMADAQMKELMAKSALHSYILADSSKFNKTYFSKVNAEVNTIITDLRRKDISYSWLEGKTKLIFANGDH